LLLFLILLVLFRSMMLSPVFLLAFLYFFCSILTCFTGIFGNFLCLLLFYGYLVFSYRLCKWIRVICDGRSLKLEVSINFRNIVSIFVTYFCIFGIVTLFYGDCTFFSSFPVSLTPKPTSKSSYPPKTKTPLQKQQ